MKNLQIILAPVFSEEEHGKVIGDIFDEFFDCSIINLREIKKMLIPGRIGKTDTNYLVKDYYTNTSFIRINDIGLMFIVIDMSVSGMVIPSGSKEECVYKDLPIQLVFSYDGYSFITNPKDINNPNLDRLLISRSNYNEYEDYVIRSLIKLVSHNNILNIDEILCRLPETEDDYIDHLISTFQSE